MVPRIFMPGPVGIRDMLHLHACMHLLLWVQGKTGCVALQPLSTMRCRCNCKFSVAQGAVSVLMSTLWCAVYLRL